MTILTALVPFVNRESFSTMPEHVKDIVLRGTIYFHRYCRHPGLENHVEVDKRRNRKISDDLLCSNDKGILIEQVDGRKSNQFLH